MQQISENSDMEAATQSHPDRSFCHTSVLRKQFIRGSWLVVTSPALTELTIIM